MTESMQRVVSALRNSPPWVKNLITFSDMQELAQMHSSDTDMRSHMMTADLLRMARQRRGR